MDPSGSQWIPVDSWSLRYKVPQALRDRRFEELWQLAHRCGYSDAMKARPGRPKVDPVDPVDPVAKHMCHVLPFCSIDFYWFLWSLHPVDVQKHSKPSITIPWSRHMFHSSFQVHSIFNRMINSGCVRFPPICHGNFGEFRHMLQHLAHLPKHPQIICFLLCLWCLCSYLINIIKHDTL